MGWGGALVGSPARILEMNGGGTCGVWNFVTELKHSLLSTKHTPGLTATVPS